MVGVEAVHWEGGMVGVEAVHWEGGGSETLWTGRPSGGGLGGRCEVAGEGVCCSDGQLLFAGDVSSNEGVTGLKPRPRGSLCTPHLRKAHL